MSKNKSRRWLKILVVAALAMVGVNIVLSRVMASGRVHRYLTPRLERAFGRKVDVSYYDFRWLPTPGVVAHYVTISEDPRFGGEYFLRAQSVVASPRWRSLLLGRWELGTLELSEPSLNLVRNPDGRWNVENWLPTPKSSGTGDSGEPRPARESARLTRIVIDGGRINFGRGLERRPFALVDVAGSIEQQSPGRWQIELEARPIRATVQLQDTGLLRVTGSISGTTVRLQPADLSVTWSNASLADALRLTSGSDHGVRGNFDLQVTAQIRKPSEGTGLNSARWEFSLGANFTGLHRWDMATRDDNPQVSVRASGAWQLGQAQFELERLLVEGPGSNIQGTGTVDWSRSITPDVRVWSPGVSFADMFSWYRAFQSGVADGITATGSVDGFASLHGWPLKPEWGSLDTDGLILKLPDKFLVGLRRTHITAEKFAIQSGRPEIVFLDIVPSSTVPALSGVPAAWEDAITFSLGAEPARITTRSSENSIWKYSFGVSGRFIHSEHLLRAAEALGRPLNRGWDAAGGLLGRLNWDWKSGEHFPKPAGHIALFGFALQVPYLNEPIEIGNEEIEIKGGERRVEISDATALGALWHGTIERREVKGVSTASDSPAPWVFDLTANHLETGMLEGWLRPPADTSRSTLPGLNVALGAKGKLHVDALDVAGLQLTKLNATVDIHGRQIEFSNLDAQAYGGKITGELQASLEADPSYSFHGAAIKIDAGDLAGASLSLEGRLSGQVSGELNVSMHGIDRENLLNSIRGQGFVVGSRVGIRGLDLHVPSGTATDPPAPGEFAGLTSTFTVGDRKIQFEKMKLINARELFVGSGTVDFGRGLEFQLQLDAKQGGFRGASEGTLLHITGQLEAPRVSAETPTRPASVHGPQPVTPVTRH